MAQKKTIDSHNAFERLHAIHKIIICLVLGGCAGFIASVNNVKPMTSILIGWDSFSICMIVMSWITFNITTPKEIRKQASVQDGSRIVIFIMILISTFASFLAVIILLVSKNKEGAVLDISVAVAGMIFSWFLMHTTFAMRYAHIFYEDHKTKAGVHAGGLDFPEDDAPGYHDFAYFSFVLGMTFQVSDVQVTSKRLRKLTLLHGIVSFGFNTVIVALTINVIAGLSK